RFPQSSCRAAAMGGVVFHFSAKCPPDYKRPGARRIGSAFAHLRAMDPSVRSARRAGLRYVCDDKAGIRREKGPLGFRFVAPNGRVIRRPADLKRIRALVIPPAWTDVWICSD